MKITLNRLNEDYLFECTNAQGNSILLDNTSQPDAKGVSPMETILMAVASCSGIDIVSILNKMKVDFSDFTIGVHAALTVEHPQTYNHVKIIYKINKFEI